jgi:hypothetical protein
VLEAGVFTRTSHHVATVLETAPPVICPKAVPDPSVDGREKVLTAARDHTCHGPGAVVSALGARVR